MLQKVLCWEILMDIEGSDALEGYQTVKIIKKKGKEGVPV